MGIDEKFSLSKDIQAEIEQTASRYFELLKEIPENDWNYKESRFTWSIRAELFHIAQAIDFIPAAVQQVRQGGRRLLPLLLIPLSWRNWINGYLIVPILSRNASREQLILRYHRSTTKIINLIGDIRNEEWDKSIEIVRGMPRNVIQVLHRPAEHFTEHESAVRSKLTRKNELK
jgi:hypothetical protein